MTLIPLFHWLGSALFTSQARSDDTFLAAAADAGDFERRLALLERRTRQQARGVVAGLYPR
jgi:hypothetical protein